MIGNIAIEPEPTKPTIGQIEVNLLAKPPFGADTEAVTYDQHSDVRDRPRAGQWRYRMEPACASVRQARRTCRSQKMIGWNVPFERELIKQSSFFDLPMPHHDSVLSQRLNQPASARATEDFFNAVGRSLGATTTPRQGF